MYYVSNDSISNNRDAIINPNISRSFDTKAVDSKLLAAKNPYQKAVSESDKSDISNEAIKLYEREKDITKFKNLLMVNLNKVDDTENIEVPVGFDDLGISNEDLASSLSSNKNFMSLLFAGD